MRALVVTNMYPSPAAPALGVFVRDQVEALRRHPGVDVEVFAFAPGGAAAYVRAARALRRRGRGAAFDVVHAHFGLSAWPALASGAGPVVVTFHGTDLAHPRSRRISLAVLPRVALAAAVSPELAARIPPGRARRPVAVLPCGVALDRFAPAPRSAARAALGLPREGPILLFPADPARAEKRVERARALAGSTRLLTLGGVPPDRVPLYVNAANAVIVPSEREGLGLAVLEALACDVPVLATPVGVHAEALAGIAGCLCAPFDAAAWRETLAPHLDAADPRVAGRARAARWSSDAMAARVLEAWREVARDQAPSASARRRPRAGQ